MAVVSRILMIVILLFSLVLSGLNILLLAQNRELKRTVARYREATEPTPGTKLPVLYGQDLEGKPAFYNFMAGVKPKTLLLVFSPHCAACDENWPMWDALPRGGA